MSFLDFLKQHITQPVEGALGIGVSGHGNLYNNFHPSPEASLTPRVIVRTSPGMLNNAPAPQTAAPAPVSSPVPMPQPSPTTIVANPHFAKFMDNTSKSTVPKQNITIPADLKAAIQAASAKYGVPAPILAAIAHKETAFQNIPQHGTGLGRGYFQIDLGQHPDITEKQAFDPNFAADWAAKYLNQNVERFSNTKTPVMNSITKYNGGLANPVAQKYAQDVLNKVQQYNYN